MLRAKPNARRRKIAAVCRRLSRVFGPVEASAPQPVLDALIATVLSQHTSGAQSDAAFRQLRRALANWDGVRQAPAKTIARAIRCAGLANIKAARIKAILDAVHADRGTLSLDFLRHRSTAETLAYLRRLPGVGPKTAACVLLFACQQPVLPVDTHVHRVSQRLGLIGPQTSVAQAHDELTRLVAPSQVLEFHIQLIRHGRSLCTARRPKCTECPLWDMCPEGMRRLRGYPNRREAAVPLPPGR